MPHLPRMHTLTSLFHKGHHHHEHENEKNMENLIKPGKKNEPLVHHKEDPFPKLVIDDVNLKDMRVLIRADFNVPMKEMKVANNMKIKAAIPTIEHCLKHGAKCVILMSHLGKPEGRVEKSYSLQPVAEELEKLLGRKVTFLEDCIGTNVEEACADPPEGTVILLENLRFHPEETGSGKNDKFEKVEPKEAEIQEFRMALSRLGDVFVNDAFGVCHRSHSSVVGITKLQKACGFQLKQEIEAFDKVLKNPERPVLAILGGAKIADKIPAVQNLLEKVNEIILVGGMSYTFLKEVEGMKIGNSLYDESQKDTIKEIMEQAHEKKVKIHLPVDFIIAEKNEEGVEDKQCSAKEGIPDDQMALDIGFETCKKFTDIIRGAKTIVWNGPAGVCENEKFIWGTKALLAAVIDTGKAGANIIVGGGETVAAICELGYADDVQYLSTGGGACLHLLQGKKLPGFEALSLYDVNNPPKREDDETLQQTDPKTGKPKEKKTEAVNTGQTVM